MIGLDKGETPAILVDKAAEWTAEYVSAVQSGVWPSEAAKTRYRHSDIKISVRTETSDKCAYCEAKVTHVHPGDCEHILPKSKRPELVVEWTNLTFVCNECNRRKSDYYEPASPLVNPYVDTPETHFRWYGPMVLASNGDAKGQATVRLLELSRPALVERRRERIQTLRDLIELWSGEQDVGYRSVLWKAIVRETEGTQEYAACAKAFVCQCLGINEVSDSAEPAHPTNGST